MILRHTSGSRGVRLRVAALGFLLAALLAGPLQAVKTGDPATDEALSKIVCICGGCPKLAVDHCTCGTAEEMASEALAISREGKDSEEIVAAFVDKYGPQVLAAPPAEGFDLTLWLGPVVALVLGALALSLFLWRKSRAGDASEDSAVGREPSLGPSPLEGFDPFA